MNANSMYKRNINSLNEVCPLTQNVGKFRVYILGGEKKNSKFKPFKINSRVDLLIFSSIHWHLIRPLTKGGRFVLSKDAHLVEKRKCLLS
jgi:hypothetical protein